MSSSSNNDETLPVLQSQPASSLASEHQVESTGMAADASPAAHLLALNEERLSMLEALKIKKLKQEVERLRKMVDSDDPVPESVGLDHPAETPMTAVITPATGPLYRTLAPTFKVEKPEVYNNQSHRKYKEYICCC